VATHVVKEFGVSLDELHNDSTCIATITFPVWRQLEFPVEGG
jgi:hypothetical protein